MEMSVQEKIKRQILINEAAIDERDQCIDSQREKIDSLLAPYFQMKRNQP